MALDKANLAIVAQSLGYKVYQYPTNDTIAVVLTNGYFDGTYGYKTLNAGDIILAQTDLDGTPYPCLLNVTVGGADVTVVAGPPTAALSISIADAGNFTSAETGEAALQEIYQHILTAYGVIEIPVPYFSAAGVALAAFSDGASDVPGFCVTAEGMGVRWNNHAAPLAVASKVLIPPDMDITANATLHVIAAKVGATVGDATKFTCGLFNNVVAALYDADSDFGGDTDAMVGDATSKTVQHLTLTLALANLAAYPCMTEVTIKPKAGTLGTDDVIMFGQFITYKKKLLTS